MISLNFWRGACCAAVIACSVFSTASGQSVATPNGSAVFVNSGTATTGQGGQLAHIQSGSLGSFTSSDTWTGIGRPQIGGSPLPFYGIRIQDNGQAGILALKNNGADRDLLMSWGTDPTTEFKLEFINDFTGVTPNTNILTAESNGNVGLGTTNPNYRLHVVNESSSPSVYAVYGINQRNLSISGYFQSDYISVYGNGLSNNSSSSQFGVYGRSFRTEGNGTNYGLFGFAGGSSGSNYGLRGSASSTGSGVKYGVYGNAPTSSGNFAGYFAGNLTYTGSFTMSSDRRLKQGIADEENALERIMQLRPTTYEYRRKGKYESMNLAEGLQHGFIAQEIEEVLPEAVLTSVHMLEEGEFDPETVDVENMPQPERFEYKSVNYISLIPILTKGIQEQQALIEQVEGENEALRAEMQERDLRIERMEQEMRDLKAELGIASEKSGGAFSAMEKESVLFANVPNPFSQSTQIRYQMAETSTTGQLLVFDMNGRQLRAYDLQKGDQTVTIEGSELEAGMYFYSLVVDGVEIDTKRMILTK